MFVYRSATSGSFSNEDGLVAAHGGGMTYYNADAGKSTGYMPGYRWGPEFLIGNVKAKNGRKDRWGYGPGFAFAPGQVYKDLGVDVILPPASSSSTHQETLEVPPLQRGTYSGNNFRSSSASGYVPGMSYTKDGVEGNGWGWKIENGKLRFFDNEAEVWYDSDPPPGVRYSSHYADRSYSNDESPMATPHEDEVNVEKTVRTEHKTEMSSGGDHVGIDSPSEETVGSERLGQKPKRQQQSTDGKIELPQMSSSATPAILEPQDVDTSINKGNKFESGTSSPSRNSFLTPGRHRSHVGQPKETQPTRTPQGKRTASPPSGDWSSFLDKAENKLKNQAQAISKEGKRNIRCNKVGNGFRKETLKDGTWMYELPDGTWVPVPPTVPNTR